jgi:plastocyanin
MKMKVLLSVVIIGVILITSASSYFMLNKDSRNPGKEQVNNDSSKDLIVEPQTPSGAVIVKSAKLDKKGFLVIRELVDGKLAQIIEMSKVLEPGSHNDVSISLVNADVSKSELIVMIYEDYDNDGVFNDLDMPALNENGNITARFIKTGKPLPTSITEREVMGEMQHNMPGMETMAKVRYTGDEFSPSEIEVPVGSMVEFINESDKDMWVASTPHPAHTILPTFDQFRAYKKGAIYRYIFDKKGSWEFHDHINPGVGGVVNVQ